MVEAEAVVCKTCTRDLFLFKPLTEKIHQLEERISAQASLETLQARIAELEALLLQAHESLQAQEKGLARHLFNIGQFILIPLLLLLMGHALVTVVYDLPLLYLRLISMALPLPFGFWLFKQRKRSLLPWFVAVVALALAAVIGMSAITGWVDKTPVLPQNMLEWREFLEYAASISFSFLTGMLLGSMAYARAHRIQTAGKHSTLVGLIHQMGEGKLSPDGVQQIMKKLESLGGTMIALGSTGMSIYTGLKSLM
jgi:hypothetical protein